MKKWHIILAILLLETLIYIAFWNHANSDDAYHKSEGFGALAWLAFYEIIPLFILGMVLVVVLVANFIIGKHLRSTLWWGFGAAVFYMPVLVYGWVYFLKIRYELWEKRRDKAMAEMDVAYADSMVVIGKSAGFQNVHWGSYYVYKDFPIQACLAETRKGEKFCFKFEADSAIEIYKDVVEAHPIKDTAYWFQHALSPSSNFLMPMLQKKLDSSVRNNDYCVSKGRTSMVIGCKSQILYMNMPEKRKDRLRIVISRGSKFRAPVLTEYHKKMERLLDKMPLPDPSR